MRDDSSQFLARLEHPHSLPGSLATLKACLGKSCSFRFTVRVFQERMSICVCASFRIGFEGGMWGLMVLVPDYRLSSVCQEPGQPI